VTEAEYLRSPLGFADQIIETEALELRSQLAFLWNHVVGGPPGKLDEDLDRCRRWFDPVAQGARLRKELALVPEVPATWVDPGDPWTMPVGESRFLVTPEGRCALDLLQNLASQPFHVIGPVEVSPYERRLLLLYKTWGRHRLNSVVELLRGTTKPLQVPAAGVVLALLVNRCTSKERALTRFASGPQREMIDRAFFAPVHAFSDAVSPTRRGNRNDPRLVSGWMLYEAGRRIGPGLHIIDAKGGRDGKVWIDSNSVDDVIKLLARDLQRGHRTRVTANVLREAFDALVASLREELVGLAPFGLSHERPIETRLLRERMLVALSQANST
jgi:hypothetical protein